MRPVLHPGLRVLVRDSGTVQVGLDHRHAVLITGPQDVTVGMLSALDGTRDVAGVLTWAAARDIAVDDVVSVLARLRGRGLVGDALTDHPLAERDRATRERLRADAETLDLLGSGGPDETHPLRVRAQAHVVVEGGGRLGAAVAHLLAAAGVAQVDVVDDGDVVLGDVSPAGHRMAAVGAPRRSALQDALLAWGARSAPRTGETPVGLVVLTDPRSRAGRRRAELILSGQPHLPVVLHEAVAEVGPLVVPGVSACVGCVDLHRSDRDPGWPAVAEHRAEHGDAGETLLVTLAATHAAVAATAHIDGRTRAPLLNGSLDITLPFGEITQRRWQPHPACGCQWDRHGGAAVASSGTTAADRAE